MAPQYKLSYFNLKALAEPIRLLLAHANIGIVVGSEFEGRKCQGSKSPGKKCPTTTNLEYVDDRVEFGDWPALKATQPWGKMPVLEVLDGSNFKLCQSVAILQYLAKKHNYIRASDKESATCAELVGAMGDLRKARDTYNHEKDDEKKSELGKVLFAETFPYYLSKFNELLEKNGTFLLGNSLTYADFYIGHFLSSSVSMQPELLDNYDALKKHQSTIFGLPGIKEWVATRPVTRF